MGEQTDKLTTLGDDIEALTVELRRLNRHRFVRLHNSILKLAWFQFIRGLAFGLGTVLGASILVSILGYMLSSINFIPILGEWAAEIAIQIQEAAK